MKKISDFEGRLITENVMDVMNWGDRIASEVAEELNLCDYLQSKYHLTFLSANTIFVHEKHLVINRKQRGKSLAFEELSFDRMTSVITKEKISAQTLSELAIYHSICLINKGYKMSKLKQFQKTANSDKNMCFALKQPQYTSDCRQALDSIQMDIDETIKCDDSILEEIMHRVCFNASRENISSKKAVQSIVRDIFNSPMVVTNINEYQRSLR